MSWHYLRGNKSCASPGQVVVVDTETLPTPLGGEDEGEGHHFRLGCATYWRIEDGKQTRRKELDFDDKKEFWRWLQEKSHPRIPTWIFAHNLPFDLKILGFFRLMDCGDFVLYPEGDDNEMDDSYLSQTWKREGLFVDDDPPTIICVHNRKGHSFKFVDTLNYWRVSLEKMGVAAGVQKMKMPEFCEDNKSWFPYCRQDCNVLEKCVMGMITWIKDLDLGKFRFSAPAQAMSAFRHRLMGHKIVLHDEARVKLLERASYFGGRVQLFYRGRVEVGPDGDKLSLRTVTPTRDGRPLGPVWQLDVTSLYPAVMKASLYPWRLTHWEFLDVPTTRKLPEFGNNAIATVLVDTQDENYPVRAKEGTVYSTGRYWSTLAGEELQHAINSGHVVSWINYAVYECADLFSSYVDTFWKLRKEFTNQGVKLSADLCKLMLNSLYGKFGQRNAKWEDRPEKYAPEPWAKWSVADAVDGSFTEYRSIANLVQQRVEVGEHPKAFPAIAAFVTAAGRMYMRKLLQLAGPKNVYYQAVDAFYCSTPGYLNLDRAGEIAVKELGKLNIELVGDSAEFRGLNNYTIGSKTVIGSIKARAIKQADGSFRQDHFESLSSMLKRPLDDMVRVYPVVKHLNNLYARGTEDQFGWVGALALLGGETSPDLTQLPTLIPAAPRKIA